MTRSKVNSKVQSCYITFEADFKNRRRLIRILDYNTLHWSYMVFLIYINFLLQKREETIYTIIKNIIFASSFEAEKSRITEYCDNFNKDNSRNMIVHDCFLHIRYFVLATLHFLIDLSPVCQLILIVIDKAHKHIWTRLQDLVYSRKYCHCYSWMDLCLIPENTTCPLHCHGNRLEKTEFDYFLHPSEVNLLKKIYYINECKINRGFINIFGAPILFSKATKSKVNTCKDIVFGKPLSTKSQSHRFHKIDAPKN